MHRARIGRVAAGTLAMLLGCGGGSTPPPTTTTSAALPAPSPTTSSLPATAPTTVPSTAPPSTLRPPTTPEEGRRILEQSGIDPDRLSQEIAEHMRRRFEPAPPQ